MDYGNAIVDVVVSCNLVLPSVMLVTKLLFIIRLPTNQRYRVIEIKQTYYEGAQKEIVLYPTQLPSTGFPVCMLLKHRTALVHTLQKHDIHIILLRYDATFQTGKRRG